MAEGKIRTSVEIWKPVPDYHGSYEVSDNGRIRSLDRQTPYKEGFRTTKGRILKFFLDGCGYPTIHLWKYRQKRIHKIHHLVALVFIGHPPGAIGRGINDYQINHKDGDKTNNHVLNLEWITHKANKLHAAQNGLTTRGTKHPNAKLAESDIREIRNLFPSLTYKEIAARYGISRNHAHQIVTGKRWGWLK